MKSLTRWGVVTAALIALLGVSTPASALHPVSLPAGAAKCLPGKIKCAIKKKACLLGVAKKAFPGDPVKIAKCKDGFDLNPAIPAKGCFSKQDQKVGNDCLTTGDAAVIEAKIDAHVQDIVDEMNPANFVGSNKCQNAKVGCVLKYNSCVLGLFAKAGKTGGPIDSTKLPKCIDGLTSCIGKLETKYAIGNPSGIECFTYGDTIALRNKDDAFIDDLIAELASAAVSPDMNTQRCTGDTSVTCTGAPAVGTCVGPQGTCAFWFGSPLPLAAGGVATCVTNRWNGGISGTFNQATGASAGTASVVATVYNGIDIGTPCPRCVGDMWPNDGANGGTCSGGGRNGLSCDSNGQSPEPSFGDTSLDCPPTGQIAAIPVDLTNSTASVTKTLSASSPNCNGQPGKKCMCSSCSGNSSIPCDSDAVCATAGAGTCTNAAGEPRKASPCVDNSATGPDESLCVSTGDGDGACLDAPVTQRCKIETFRSCTVDGDCTAPGDTCGTFGRECFPGYNGVVGNTITSVGSTTAPRNHAGVQQFASVFCVSPTSQPAVNAAAGLPGPGRLSLGGVGSENASAGVCPTRAEFLPTFKGGILDTGWTGIAHDAKVVGQGKVSVAVSACSGAADSNGNGCGTCTYSGPIANPDALP